MTSIQTNTAAMSSLQSLAATQRDLARVQSQVSTGLAVSAASDNAAYWTIGRQMSAQIAGLDAVDQGLALTRSIADVTAAALVAIKGAVDRIQDAVVAARQPGLDRTALQAEISAQQQSIIAIANGAGFNGVNWLLNTLSRSESVTTTITLGDSRSQFDAVLLGQRKGDSTNLQSTVVDETTVTENGVSASQTRTTAYDVTTTDDPQDGTPTTRGGQTSDTTTGSANFSTFGTVSLPMSVSASGLSSSSLSLAPLILFTDFTGKSTVQQTVTADHVPDLADSYGPFTSIGTSYSYDGYGGGAAPGILDPIVVTATGMRASSSSGSGGSSGQSQSTVNLTATGGYVTTSGTGPSGSGSGSGPTTSFFQESILDLDVVGLSADDLAAVEQGVRTAIGSLIGASAIVGALQTQVSTQQSYNSALVDSLTSGVGSLVDVDMNLASTRLQALQAQQQLGIQALSIANEDSRLVLKLFGGA